MAQDPLPYFLGCPMWQNRAWVGSFLKRGTRPSNGLAAYASVFNSVEGNTTFYALPKPEQALRWRDQTPAHFRFTFKFPKSISHEQQLKECGPELERFFKFLEPIEDRVGCLFLQMPPQFRDFERLARFLETLPRAYAYAIEVRHLAFFDEGPGEAALQNLLRQNEMDQVLFDTTRLLSCGDRSAPILEAIRKKPKMPRRVRALGKHPFLRYVGRPTILEDLPVLDFWAQEVASWIQAGKQPFVFMHQAPEDDQAPQLCQHFHQALGRYLPALPPLPPFPCQEKPEKGQQLSLFDEI